MAELPEGRFNEARFLVVGAAMGPLCLPPCEHARGTLCWTSRRPSERLLRIAYPDVWRVGSFAPLSHSGSTPSFSQRYRTGEPHTFIQTA